MSHRPLPLLVLPLIAALGLPAGAQPAPPAAEPPSLAPLTDPDFQPLPLHSVAEAVGARYQGRLVAAETRPPRPFEQDLGAELVYEFRLLTPARNMLVLRLDARTGRFLDVAGRGQIEARQPR